MAERTLVGIPQLIGATRKINGGIVPTMTGLMLFGQFDTIVLEVLGFMLDYGEYENDGFEWTERYPSGTPG